MTRILHLSDLHVVAPPERASAKLETARLLSESVDCILATMHRFAPLDAVLVSGDISDDGSPESYEIAYQQLMRLGLPLLVLPGNHDRREPLRRCFADALNMPDTGLIDWACDIGGLRLVGLDTLSEAESAGTLRDETLDFVKRTVAESEGRPLLIALHHPPFETGIRFMDTIGLARRADLAAILDAVPNPVRIVAGHIHTPIVGTFSRHTVCTAPAVCSGFAVDFRKDALIGFMSGPRGYMVHEWSAGFRSYSLDFDPREGPFPF